MTDFLPKHANLEQSCDWLQSKIGEKWTLQRILECGIWPSVWLDYTPGYPAVFGGRLEGYLAPMIYAGDTERLATDAVDVLITMTRTHDGQLLKIDPGLRGLLSDLRFARDELKALAAGFLIKARTEERQDAVTFAEYQAQKLVGDILRLHDGRPWPTDVIRMLERIAKKKGYPQALLAVRQRLSRHEADDGSLHQECFNWLCTELDKRHASEERITHKEGPPEERFTTLAQWLNELENSRPFLEFDIQSAAKRRADGRYLLTEAAEILAGGNARDEDGIGEKLLEAARLGEIPVFEQGGIVSLNCDDYQKSAIGFISEVRWKDLNKWLDSAPSPVDTDFRFPDPSKLDACASETLQTHESETPEGRRARLVARKTELKKEGVHNFNQVIAKEEGIHISRVKQLIEDGERAQKPVKSSPFDAVVLPNKGQRY